MIENTQAEPDEMDEFERLFGDNAEADAVEKAWAELENGTFQPKPKPPEWHVIESPYHPGLTIPAKTYDAIMFGITPCTFCNGTGEITVVEQWGDTDIRRTVSRPCRVETKMREKKAYIKRLLPSRYQRSNILSLEPSPNSKMSLERQARVIRFLKDNQHRGYFFFGGPGTGKTTYATSLVRGALERSWDKHIATRYSFSTYITSFWIHYLNWDTYIQSLLDWQNHPDTAEEPALSPNLIRQNKSSS